jgi:RND family efflux transporter MFP subunit
VASSTARIGEAQQAVDNCVIRAPFDGIIVSKDAQVGEMVSPISAGGGFTRTGIATIVDMNSNEVEVDVNESYIARVKPGQRAIATLDAYPDWQIPSSVRTVIPTADRQKATVKVRVSFDHLDPKILPDMGVKVAFLSDEPKTEGKAPVAKAIIPQNVVRKEGEASVVWLVKGGKIERRAVTLGAEHGKRRGSDGGSFRWGFAGAARARGIARRTRGGDQAVGGRDGSSQRAKRFLEFGDGARTGQEVQARE